MKKQKKEVVNHLGTVEAVEEKIMAKLRRSFLCKRWGPDGHRFVEFRSDEYGKRHLIYRALKGKKVSQFVARHGLKVARNKKGYLQVSNGVPETITTGSPVVFERQAEPVIPKKDSQAASPSTTSTTFPFRRPAVLKSYPWLLPD